MKIKYDFHVHSALSPCADNDMTPVNIVAYAKMNGLDMVAIADHNAIENVEVGILAGEFYGVTVVPAIEVQTVEDIHVLCLFETFDNLKAFYETLEMPPIKNKPDIFGEQLILNEDDEIVAYKENLLLVSCTVSSAELPTKVAEFGGIAVAAHIEREANGMLQILGAIESGYTVVELSTRATDTEVESYRKKYKVLVDSDAHTLESIGMKSELELDDNTIKSLFRYLKGE